jgi:hypothetical protein
MTDQIVETMSARGKRILAAKRKRAGLAYVYHHFTKSPTAEDRIAALTKYINFEAKRVQG